MPTGRRQQADNLDGLSSGLRRSGLNDGKGGAHRLAAFKSGNRDDGAERRRREALARQKKRRFDQIAWRRGLNIGDDDTAVTVEASSVEEDETIVAESGHEDASTEKMDSETAENFQRKRRINEDKLMLSEWMKVIPEDLATNWCFTICPKARRCLVTAARGVTTAYRRNGKQLSRFPSSLPGGSRKQRASARDYTILDCLMDESTKTFYVLDCMAWHGHEVFDSDLEFRSFFMHAKFEEEPELANRMPSNPYAFLPLFYNDCTPELVQMAAGTRYPFEVDGFLFFHKEILYSPGTTPLALWLKPHMLADVLGIPIPEIPVPLTDAVARLVNKVDTNAATDGTMESEQPTEFVMQPSLLGSLEVGALDAAMS